jgi:cytochrome c oxidase subunit III
MSASTKHSAHTGPTQWPKDSVYGASSAGKLGMWVFLISDAITFAGLLMSYGALRAASTIWRCTPALASTGECTSAEPTLGIGFTAALTFLLICSSVTMVMSHAALTENNYKQASRYLALTVLCGLLFLLGQVHEYFGVLAPLLQPLGIHSAGLYHEGLFLGQSLYASSFYIITSFHGLHVLSGVLYLSVVLSRTMRQKSTANEVEIVGLFWHFVDLVWILVFTFVYLIPE